MNANKDENPPQDVKTFQKVYEKDHKKTSYLETLMHLLKANVGTGCFALGAAFMYCGIILGPILLCIIGLINVHAQHLLIKCADHMTLQINIDTPLSYSEVMEMILLTSSSKTTRKFAQIIKKLCTTFICTGQLGFCCVYLLFVASNIKELGDYYGIKLDIYTWITITVIPIWMSTMIRTLKVLGRFLSI